MDLTKYLTRLLSSGRWTRITPQRFILLAIFLIIYLVVYSISHSSDSGSEEVESNVIEGNVIEVIDGDTIKIMAGGNQEVVRLIGLNAPERGDCMHMEATQYLESLVLYKMVRVEGDPTQGERDRYDRLLAYIYVDDVNAAEEVIRSGFAREYTYDDPYKFLDQFKAAESQAKDSVLGIWSQECMAE